MTQKELLQSYQEEEEYLLTQLDKINEKIKQLKLTIIKDEFNIEIGSVIKHRNRLYKVSSIDTRYDWTKPWISGVAHKRDGTWGVREVYLYEHWELVP